MRPPFTKPAGIFNMAANMTRSWCVVRFSKTMISLPLVRQTLLGGTSSMSTEAAANHVTFERPTKKKEFRRVKAEIYKKNRQDSKLERLARKGALSIPLETVRKEWMAKYEFSTTTKLARHHGIFENMFQGNEFIPSVRMLVTFGQTDQVHYGNFLTPSQASQKPTVNYDCSEDSYWTLILANPDGNLLEKKKEILHWMIGNIPGSRVSDGELLCDYLPPIPIQGTGFHRFVFCLLKQSGELDLNNYVNTKPREIASRTFSLAEFLSKHGKDFTPAGLCFFQAIWDKSVTQTFTEILDMTEPAYKEQEFVTPTKARRILVRQWLEGKYRNM